MPSRRIAGRADVVIIAASDANQVTTAADEGATAADTGGTGEADVCSFAASTPVATPSGERPTGSLKVGDHVLAYQPDDRQADHTNHCQSLH